MGPYEKLMLVIESLNMSQVEVSERVQEYVDEYGGTPISQGHLSLVIRSKRDPAVSIMVTIAKTLNISLDWLYDIQPMGSNVMSPDEKVLVDLYRAIDNMHMRKIVLEMARLQASTNEAE